MVKYTSVLIDGSAILVYEIGAVELISTANKTSIKVSDISVVVNDKFPLSVVTWMVEG
jgi:hypothetical protein